MKKLITIISLFFPFFGMPQSIQGIGPFKIGITTIDIIQKIETDNNAKFVKVYSKEEFSNKTPERDRYMYHIELVRSNDSVRDIIYEASIDPRVRTFYITYYKVNDIAIRDIKIKFFNDTLFYVSVFPSESLVNAIELKYGQGKKKESVMKSDCIDKLTNKNFENHITDYTWRDDSIFIGRSSSTIYSTYDCKPHSSFSFFAWDKSISDVVYKYEKSRPDGRKILTKDQLKDF